MRTALEPLAQRVARALLIPADAAALSDALFAAVARDIPSVFACLATVDPSTGLITGAYKSADVDIRDEAFSALEYGEPDINQFSVLAARKDPVGALGVDTDGHPERCRRFREYMAPEFGFTDELRLACRTHGVLWGALALYRGPGEPAFTAEEAAALLPVHEVVAAAVRRVLLASVPWDGGATGAPAVLVVDRADRVTDRGEGADAALADLGHAVEGALPSNVLAATAAARATGAVRTMRVLGTSGTWLAVRAMPLTGGAVVLTVEPAARAALGLLALAAQGLTAREADVVRLVLDGASTRTIAATLHLSAYTVQDHLKSVFGKAGVSSRRELLARFVH